MVAVRRRDREHAAVEQPRGAPLDAPPGEGATGAASASAATKRESQLPPALRRAALARAREDEAILAMIADYRPDKNLVGGSSTARRTRGRSKTPVRGAGGGGGGKPATRLGSLRVAANVGQSQTLFVTDPLQQGVQRRK